MVNCEVMVDARKSGCDPTMFMSGNSAEAKAEEILQQFNLKDIIDLDDSARLGDAIANLATNLDGYRKRTFFF
ncbi:hypothetical protein WG947_16635 [Pontibacter sp. H259]|uniref:hypothetical protein n=1 Tax=Pontibacter sp. H259 TaxID=3133421 RepID=UPI0030BFDF59